MNDSLKELYRKQLASRLLAVTFIPGGQGSFFCGLLQNSGGVAVYERSGIDDRLDHWATSHQGNEQWLSHCHHWDQAELLNDDYFFNNLSLALLEELDRDSGLIPFRCHPAVTKKLCEILPSIKVLYIDHNDFYKPYRLYYEKLIKPLGNDWFVESFARLIKHRPSYLTEEIRLQLLVRWFDHTDLTAGDFADAYVINADDYFQYPWLEYCSMIEHFNLTPMTKTQLDKITLDYHIKQLALPINDLFEQAVKIHSSRS